MYPTKDPSPLPTPECGIYSPAAMSSLAQRDCDLVLVGPRPSPFETPPLSPRMCTCVGPRKGGGASGAAGTEQQCSPALTPPGHPLHTGRRTRTLSSPARLPTALHARAHGQTAHTRACANTPADNSADTLTHIDTDTEKQTSVLTN